MKRVAAAVLAAGSGTRMGTPKADLVVDGIRLVDHAVRVARDAGCAPVVAVVRPGTEVADAQVVVNPDPDRGMRSSLALAVGAVDADAVAIVLADMPGVTAEAIRAVATTWRPGRIAVGRYASGRAHPTVMSAELWRAALDMAGPDEGARRFVATHPELVDDVPVPGDPADLDTRDDLARWQRY